MIVKFLITAIVVIGLRMVGAAIYAAFTGKVLVRKGVRTQWVTASNRDATWGIVFRDGLMGILLVVLGVALIS